MISIHGHGTDEAHGNIGILMLAADSDLMAADGFISRHDIPSAARMRTNQRPEHNAPRPRQSDAISLL